MVAASVAVGGLGCYFFTKTAKMELFETLGSVEAENVKVEQLFPFLTSDIQFEYLFVIVLLSCLISEVT